MFENFRGHPCDLDEKLTFILLTESRKTLTLPNAISLNARNALDDVEPTSSQAKTSSPDGASMLEIQGAERRGSLGAVRRVTAFI